MPGRSPERPIAVLADPALQARQDRRRPSRPRSIGSVLPWPDAGPPVPDSLWAAWTAGWRTVSAYGSARAALAALLAFRGITRLWLPAYSCTALAHAAAPCEPCWYGVDASLAPDLGQLARSVRRGDAVLVIDYFGRAAGPGLAALAASRPEVLWIEDRAQAMDHGVDPFADVVLYSPRKLIGVGEGGLLVANGALPTPSGPPAHRPAQAQVARAADPEGHDPAAWFPQFRAQEAAFGIDDAPMGEPARAVLGRVAAAPLARRRRANAAILANRLDDLALWSGGRVDFTPMAFPIRVQDCAALAAKLAIEGIYCARHWADLPSDAAEFPLAHRLAGEVLSLPCDHRYDAADMLRVVDAVRACRARPAARL